MKTFKKIALGKIAGSLLVASGMLFSGLAIASPAQAASCHNWSCNNVDPLASGCSAGAVTIGYHYGGDIRFSFACQAAWFRRTPSVHHNLYQFSVYNQGFAGYHERDFRMHYGSATQIPWTTMIPMRVDETIQFKIGSDTVSSPIFNTTPVP